MGNNLWEEDVAKTIRDIMKRKKERLRKKELKEQDHFEDKDDLFKL